MGRCPPSPVHCLIRALLDLNEIIIQKRTECNFHGNLEADVTLFALSLCTVNGKSSSLHKSQLLFSLQCKLGPSIFCHIKDANNQFYFLSCTTMHKSFRSCSKMPDIYLSMNPNQILEKENNLGFVFACSLQKVKTA